MSTEDDLRQRIMELESQLQAAHEDIDSLRLQLERSPRQEKENELYTLDRRVTISETKNKGKIECTVTKSSWNHSPL